jgi:carbonic anhydrase/acetyltransferase-like protein (isoleucine patch superfamily)
MAEPLILSIRGRTPELHPESWVAPSANIIGWVRLGARASVWYSATLRAEAEPIDVGVGSNIQDGATLHVDPEYPLRIGAGVTVGHNAVLHGCTVEDGCLIGMGAIVLNGAKIGANSLVGAGALITEGKEFQDNSVILGSPAKAVRETDDKVRAMIARAAEVYVRRWKQYTKGLSRIG